MAIQPPPGYDLRTAVHHGDFASFARLAQDYHAWLNVDLCFQSFSEELASLPGCYAQPTGCILLASHTNSGDTPIDVGCVGVRPLKTNAAGCSSNQADAVAAATAPAADANASRTCEMKRLWVQHAHQKSGLGRVLVSAALQKAKQMGYMFMVLDTLETLTAANALYDKLGFVRRDAYYSNPLPGVVYWQKQLD